MYEFPLLYPERVADATIRGFLYQIIWSTLHWLSLGSNEVLLCEGDEDLDRCIYDGSVLRSTEQSQFKALAGRISIRNKEVYESVFNFMISFHYHHEAGRACVFRFTTTASVAKQQTDNTKFSVKVLQTWMAFSKSMPTKDKEGLVISIKSAVSTYKELYAKKADGTQDPQKSKRLEDALAYLDGHGLWDDFLTSVRWATDGLSEKELRIKITERIGEIDSLKGSDDRIHAILAARLVDEVLSKCCNPKPDDRLLTKKHLEELLGLTIDALRDWAQSRGLAPLVAEISQLKKEIEGIKANVSDLQRRQPATLEEITSTSLSQLAQRAYFDIDGTKVHITRTASNDLLIWAQAGSCVVIGSPGIGKSAILYTLGRALQDSGHVVVVTTVAKFLSQPHLIQEIHRRELKSTGFLLIDGIDAQRGDRNALYDAIEGLIHENPQWRIIASVRKFDLENDPRLQRMFLGRPHEKYYPAGIDTGQGIYKVRCFEIRHLDDAELKQIEAQAPTISSLIALCSEQLKELLYNPFNLSIVARLLSGGKNTSLVLSIATQVDLLDKYWSERLSEDPKEYRDAREALLSEICEKMMQVPALELSVTTLRTSLRLDRLNDILLSGILNRNQEEDLVEFSHNILFDYAIARYWLKHISRAGAVQQPSSQDYQALRIQLEERGDLILLVYPSLEMFFIQLWELDPGHQTFWRCVLELAVSAKISAVLLVAPAAVASRMAQVWSDLEPLCSALTSVGEPGHKMVQRVVSALANQPEEDLGLVGPSAAPWCQWAEWLARTGEPSLLDAARRLLWLLTPPTDHVQVTGTAPKTTLASSLTADQQISTHKAAIAYFDYIWATLAPDIRLLETSIQLICRNIAPKSTEIISRLRPLLAPEKIDEIGFVAIPAIARSIRYIFEHDIDFVIQAYICAFQYRETRHDIPVHRGGPVFGMQSNRKQDYESGLYELGRKFEQLLNKDPYKGTLVLISVMREFEKSATKRFLSFQQELIKDLGGDALPEVEKPKVEQIAFESRTVHFQRDHSASSDKSSESDDYEIKLLDTWTQWLDKILSNDAAKHQAEKVIDALIDHNSLERIWMRLLRVATRHVSILGKRLLPIACNTYVFASEQRQKDIGLFIGKTWPLLSENERKDIEASLNAFLDSTKPELKNWATEVRETLLKWIHNSNVEVPAVSTRMRRGLDDVTGDDLPAEDTSASDRKVDKVKKWHAQRDHLSRAILSEASVAEIRADMAELFGALTTSHDQEHGETDLSDEEAWGYLASIAAAMASREDLMSQPGLFTELKAYLLGAAQRATPRPERMEPLSADDSLAWGFPATRKDAAMGLCELMRKSPSGDSEISTMIEKLALADKSSLVRTEIASYAACIYQKNTSLHEKYLAHIQNDEKSGAVVWRWMQSSTLWGIAKGALDSALNIIERLVERFGVNVADDEGAKKKPNRILELALNYYAIWFANFSHSRLDRHIEKLVTEPWTQYAQHIPGHFYEAVVFDLIDPSDELKSSRETLRARAWCLLELLCDAAYDTYVELTNKKTPLTEVEKERLMGVQHTLFNLARMAWHLLEAHNQERIRDGEQNVQLGPISVRKGFFEYARKILRKLATLDVPSISEELIKALSGSIDFVPKEALLLAAESMTNSVPRGLATDTFAEHTVGNFIRRYLTDQRSLLQQDKEAREALLRMLSPFVDIGWPEMQKLVFRLADAFR